MKTIGGNSIQACTKFIWDIIHSLKFKNTMVITKEDLFQVGFIKLIQLVKKRYRLKNKVYLVSTRLGVKFYIIKYIRKFRSIVKVAPSMIEKYYTMNKKHKQQIDYADDLFDYNSLNDKVDVSMHKYKVMCTPILINNIRLYMRNYRVSLYSLEVINKLNYLPRFNLIDDILIFLAGDKTVCLLDKQIFLKYYGICSKSYNVEYLMYKYNCSKIYVYNAVHRVRVILKIFIEEELEVNFKNKINKG